MPTTGVFISKEAYTMLLEKHSKTDLCFPIYIGLEELHIAQIELPGPLHNVATHRHVHAIRALKKTWRLRHSHDSGPFPEN
jgi:hypothetical protein